MLMVKYSKYGSYRLSFVFRRDNSSSPLMFLQPLLVTLVMDEGHLVNSF